MDNPEQMQQQQEAELAAQVEQLEIVVKQKMTKEAVSRYGNIKAAHPEKAVQFLGIAVQLLQAGKIDNIDDNAIKDILRNITPAKKEFRINQA